MGFASGLAALLPAAHAADPPPAPPATPLEAIVVTAPKLSVETLIDRKVYNVKADLQSSFGTLGDVLNAIPAVDVDPDGIVSLRGDSNVLILVDGKPSPQFSGPAAGENIRSLSAMDIERIEVMTTPPAQFKADGAAGVINIITRKSRPKGLAGSAQASVGSHGRFNVGTNTSYVSGPLTVNLTAGFRHDYRSRVLESSVLAPNLATATVQSSRSELDESIHRGVPSATLSTQYALDERQTLSASVDWSERGGLRAYTQRNDSITLPGAVGTSTQRLSRGHDPEFNHDEKLGYTRQLGTEGEKIDVTVHRSTSQQREHYAYLDTSFLPPGPTASSNLSLLDDEGTTDVAVDYALPLANSRTLKLGYAYEQDDVRFGSYGANLDPLAGSAIVDPTLTHDFAYRQRIEAGYASFQAGVGPWNLQAGLRAELTTTHSQQLTQGLDNSGSYSGLYPSVHVERSLSDVSTLSMAAGRRVSRPDPGNLDPYVDHEYTPNLRAGNPGLAPQNTQSYELGYSYEKDSVRYQVNGYYRQNRNSATDVTQYLGNGLSLTTKTNLPRNDAEGVEISAGGKLVSKLSYNLSSNLFHSQIDAAAFGTAGLRSTNGVNAKLKLDFRPTDADTAQLVVTRTARRLTPQGYVSAIDLVNLGYKHQLQRNLNVVATLTDIFNGQRNERTESTPTFTGSYLRAVQGRVIYVGVVYSFGAGGSGKDAKLEYEHGE